MGIHFNSLNLEHIHQQQQAELRNNARMRDEFFEENNWFIQQVLFTDLENYQDRADIAAMHLITMDQYVSAFLEKVSNVYDEPPLFKFPDERAENENVAAFYDLMNEVEYASLFHEIEMRVRLHNTIIPLVKYNEQLDKVHVEPALSPAMAKVFPFPEYVYEPMVLAYEEPLPQQQSRWVLWDRRDPEMIRHYYMDLEPKYDEVADEIYGQEGRKIRKKKTPVNPEAQDLAGPPFWPMVTYRVKKQQAFWGNGMDWLVDLVRAVNILLTVIEDDSIQETLRLLILNFQPTGQQGEKGQLKVGLRHPIFQEGSVGGDTDPSGEILDADLYNEEILSFIQSLDEIVTSLNNIPAVLRSEMRQELSGVALQIRNEPLLRQWRKDINRLRGRDRELIETIVTVHNYYRDDRQIDPAILTDLSIEYQTPTMVTDEKQEYELERMQWKDKISSPVKYLLDKHPRWTKQDALDHIQENQEELREAFPAGLPQEGNSPRVSFRRTNETAED